MFFCEINFTRRLRRFQLHKVKQLILVLVIIGLLCFTYPETILFTQSRAGIQRADPLGIRQTADKEKCLLLHSLDETYRCEEVVLMHANINDFTERKNSSTPRESKVVIGVQKNDVDLEKEMRLKVKTTFTPFVKRNKAVMKQHVSVNSSIYQDIPPVYDELIKVTMNTKTRCKDAGEYNAIVAVHTAPSNFQNRAVFRWLYGDFTKTKPKRFKVIFFVGLVTNTTLQDLLKRENEQHDDLVQGNFIDAYINMTYKAVMVFNYLDNYCSQMRSLFRVDDDVFMNIGPVFDRWAYVHKHYREKTFMCYLFPKDRVLRKGKWAVPEALIPEDNYEFMRCPGYFVAMTVDLIHLINEKVRKLPFFWIDDIVLLGLVPKSIPGVFFYPFNKWMANPKKTKEFENCIRTRGANCNIWVGITQTENFQSFYGYISGSIPLKRH